MTDVYEPPSDFLKAVVADEVPLSGSMFAAANLTRLIAMTRDPDRANRDWAALLLSQQDIDTPEVRAALRAAANDQDAYVRAEAICGLAGRDPAGALTLVRRELDAGYASVAILEAATLLAHPSLLDVLQDYAEPSDDPWLDKLVLDAIATCSDGPPD